MTIAVLRHAEHVSFLTTTGSKGKIIVMKKSPSGIAAEIRAEIARQGIKHSAVAEAIGLSRSALSKRLSGTQSLSAVDVERIAAVLGVSVGYLYGEQAA